jgi:hypothetical protein
MQYKISITTSPADGVTQTYEVCLTSHVYSSEVAAQILAKAAQKFVETCQKTQTDRQKEENGNG